MSDRTVGALAQLVRAKNAGPFWLTIDVFCADDDAYHALAAPGVITPQRIADLYAVDAASVGVFRLPELRVVKVSFPRRVVQGSPFDRDMHGGQQHVPLTSLTVDAS